MQKFRKILVGLDFDRNQALTAGSRTAAEKALWLAARTGARVDFLHSQKRSDEDEATEPDAASDVTKSAVDAFLSECGANPADSEFFVVDEKPWLALMRKALAGDVDLIVVAKRNYSRRDDRKLGSVSIKLVHNCPVPVWVINPTHTDTHQCVLAATDLSPVGDMATEYGAFIAQAEECSFCVVHAWQMPMELQLSSARIGAEETNRRRKEIAQQASKHIRGLSGVAELQSSMEIFLACDSPSHAILQAVEKKQPDLVVMGTISRAGLAGLLVGNTAEKLLYKLDCSLLTIKPKDFVCPISLD